MLRIVAEAEEAVTAPKQIDFIQKTAGANAATVTFPTRRLVRMSTVRRRRRERGDEYISYRTPGTPFRYSIVVDSNLAPCSVLTQLPSSPYDPATQSPSSGTSLPAARATAGASQKSLRLRNKSNVNLPTR